MSVSIYKTDAGGVGATEVSAFSPNFKFIAASCCSRKQFWLSVHYGAILNPVVFSVSMGSFHNHSSGSPGSPRFCAEALCLIPVCKEWGCNTQRCHLGADGRHDCDFSPELKLPREVPRGRIVRMQRRLRFFGAHVQSEFTFIIASSFHDA